MHRSKLTGTYFITHLGPLLLQWLKTNRRLFNTLHTVAHWEAHAYIGQWTKQCLLVNNKTSLYLFACWRGFGAKYDGKLLESIQVSAKGSNSQEFYTSLSIFVFGRDNMPQHTHTQSHQIRTSFSTSQITTSAKRVMFSVRFCLFASRFTENLLTQFPWNLVEGCNKGHGKPN